MEEVRLQYGATRSDELGVRRKYLLRRAYEALWKKIKKKGKAGEISKSSL